MQSPLPGSCICFLHQCKLPHQTFGVKWLTLCPWVLWWTGVFLLIPCRFLWHGLKPQLPLIIIATRKLHNKNYPMHYTPMWPICQIYIYSLFEPPPAHALLGHPPQCLTLGTTAPVCHIKNIDIYLLITSKLTTTKNPNFRHISRFFIHTGFQCHHCNDKQNQNFSSLLFLT